MDQEKNNFSSLEIVGDQTDAGICGPDGCKYRRSPQAGRKE